MPMATTIGPGGLQTLDMRLHAPGVKDFGKRRGEVLRSLPEEVIARTLRSIEQRLKKSDLAGAISDLRAAFEDTEEMLLDERIATAQRARNSPIVEIQKAAVKKYLARKQHEANDASTDK